MYYFIGMIIWQTQCSTLVVLSANNAGKMQTLKYAYMEQLKQWCIAVTPGSMREEHWLCSTCSISGNLEGP